MGIFFKVESKISDYKDRYLLRMKFKRFGNDFYLESNSSKFLNSLSSLALYYYDNKSSIYNEKTALKLAEERPDFSSYGERLNWMEKPENIILLYWNGIFNDVINRHKGYYNVWIGDVESSIAVLNYFLVSEGILKDMIILSHFKIVKNSSIEFPPKHQTIEYKHLEKLWHKNQICNDLTDMISQDEIVYNPIIIKILSILERKKFNDIKGNLVSNVYNSEMYRSMDVLNEKLECENLLYLIVARDFICRSKNLNNELNLSEVTLKELLEVLELYEFKHSGNYYSTYGLYLKVMELTNNPEKIILAEKREIEYYNLDSCPF